MSLNNKDRLIFTYVAANDAQYGDIYSDESKLNAFKQFSKDNPNVAFLLDNPGDIWKNGQIYASYNRTIQQISDALDSVGQLVDEKITTRLAPVNNTISDINTTLSHKIDYVDSYDVVLNNEIVVNEVYISDIGGEVPQTAPDGYYIAGTPTAATLYHKSGSLTPVDASTNMMYRVSVDAHNYPGFYALRAYTLQMKQVMDDKYNGVNNENTVEPTWVFLQGDVATTNVSVETVSYAEDVRSYIDNSDNETLKQQQPDTQHLAGTILNLIIGGDQPNYLVVYAGGANYITASHVISSAADIQSHRTFDGETSTNILNKIVCVNAESTSYVGRMVTFNSSLPAENPIAASTTSSFNLYAPKSDNQSSPYMISLPKSSGTLITDSIATAEYLPWERTVYSKTSKNPCKIVSGENGSKNAAIPYIDTTFNMNVGNKITMYSDATNNASNIELTMPHSSGRILTDTDMSDVVQYDTANPQYKYYIVGHQKNDASHVYSSDSNAPYMMGDNLYYSSDERLKDNIHEVSDGLVETVGPDIIKSFEYKATGKKAYGFIAQELEKIIPEAVNYDNDTYAVDYNSALSAVVGVLLKRIDKQQHEIDELKKRLDELK